MQNYVPFFEVPPETLEFVKFFVKVAAFFLNKVDMCSHHSLYHATLERSNFGYLSMR